MANASASGSRRSKRSAKAEGSSSTIVHAEASSSASAPGPVASTSSAIILDLNAPPPAPRLRKSAKAKGKGKAPATSTIATRDRRASDGEVKICEALDRWGESCDEVVVGGHKGKVARSWCAVHETEERRVRFEFTDAVDLLAMATEPLPTTEEVKASVSLDELEEWEAIARARAGACNTALRCIEYHLKHFEAALDLTDGLPKSFGSELAMKANKCESMIKLIITQSHYNILQCEDALWLLEPPPPAPPPCGALSTTNPLGPNAENGPFTPSNNASIAHSSSSSSSASASNRPPLPPTLQTESEQPSPILALEAQERSSLLELLSLTGSHASFIKDVRKSVERVRIVECLFRRLISRDEELLVKAYRGGHDHVLRFFEDPLLCSLSALRRLQTAFQATSAISLKEAIMDAFRAIAWEESGAGETEDGEEGIGLQLLGGWVYKVQLERSMSVKEWGHLYDLCGCPGCVLRCCMRFQDWAMIRRLTVVPSSPSTGIPPYEQWGDPTESDSNRIMRAIDVVRCAESGVGASEPETRRVGGALLGGKGKGVWVERVERNWMMVKISITHPRALPLLTALSTPFTILVRSRLTPSHPLPSYPIPPPSHLWFSRHRSAPSKPLLRHQAWTTDPDGFGTGNSIPASILGTLDTLESPEKLQGMPPWEEVYEVLILDGWGHEGEGTGFSAGEAVYRSYERFEAEVGQIMCEGGLGVKDVKGAVDWGARESYRRGDLLWEFGAGEGGRKKKVDVRELVKGAFRDAGVDPTQVELEVQDERTSGKGKEVDVAAGVLSSLRDDALAFKLSRSLFR